MINIKFFIILLAIIAPASGGTLQVLASTNGDTGALNLTQYAPNLASQVVIEIPSGVFIENSQTYIDRITFYCAYTDSYVTPNGNFNVRILWRDDTSVFDNGNWQLLDSNYYNIPASTCNDYSVPISFYTDEQVNIQGSYFGFNHSVPIGIGIATTSTNGARIVYANTSVYPNETYTFLQPTNSSYSPIIKYINRTNIIADSDSVDFMPINIYGGVATPTPTPTPTPSTPAPIPTPDSGNHGNLFPNGTDNGTGMFPSPHVQGGNAVMINATIGNGTGAFCEFGNASGYDCTVGGYIQMSQDYMTWYVIFGILIYIMMLWTKQRG